MFITDTKNFRLISIVKREQKKNNFKFVHTSSCIVLPYMYYIPKTSGFSYPVTQLSSLRLHYNFHYNLDYGGARVFFLEKNLLNIEEIEFVESKSFVFAIKL